MIEQHVRRFLEAHPDMRDKIDEAIPGECGGETARQTAERLGLMISERDV